MSSASGPPDPAGGDGNQKVEQKPLSEKAQVYRAYCMSAWQDFKDAKYDEANEMALWLLGQAEIGPAFRAISHLILAHSPDRFVHHAEKAVEYFTPLAAGGDPTVIGHWLPRAKKALENAKADQKYIDENPLTEEEYHEQLDAYLKAVDEEAAELAAAEEACVNHDWSDDSECDADGQPEEGDEGEDGQSEAENETSENDGSDVQSQLTVDSLGQQASSQTTIIPMRSRKNSTEANPNSG